MLTVSQATTWELISFSGNKPSGRNNHVAAWSNAAGGFYIHGGEDANGGGLRRSGEQWNGVSEASWTSCGLPRMGALGGVGWVVQSGMFVSA